MQSRSRALNHRRVFPVTRHPLLQHNLVLPPFRFYCNTYSKTLFRNYCNISILAVQLFCRLVYELISFENGLRTTVYLCDFISCFASGLLLDVRNSKIISSFKLQYCFYHCFERDEIIKKLSLLSIKWNELFQKPLKDSCTYDVCSYEQV